MSCLGGVRALEQTPFCDYDPGGQRPGAVAGALMRTFRLQPWGPRRHFGVRLALRGSCEY